MKLNDIKSQHAAVKAMKAFCWDCSQRSIVAISDCWDTKVNSKVCEVHKYFSSGPSSAGRWVMGFKAIKKECIRCMGVKQTSSAIEQCKSRTCKLWPFRFGIGVKSAFKKGLDVEP